MIWIRSGCDKNAAGKRIRIDTSGSTMNGVFRVLAGKGAKAISLQFASKQRNGETPPMLQWQTHLNDTCVVSSLPPSILSSKNRCGLHSGNGLTCRLSISHSSFVNPGSSQKMFSLCSLLHSANTRRSRWADHSPRSKTAVKIGRSSAFLLITTPLNYEWMTSRPPDRHCLDSHDLPRECVTLAAVVPCWVSGWSTSSWHVHCSRTAGHPLHSSRRESGTPTHNRWCSHRSPDTRQRHSGLARSPLRSEHRWHNSTLFLITTNRENRASRQTQSLENRLEIDRSHIQEIGGRQRRDLVLEGSGEVSPTRDRDCLQSTT